MVDRYNIGDRVELTCGFSRGTKGSVTEKPFLRTNSGETVDYGVLRDGASVALGFWESDLIPYQDPIKSPVVSEVVTKTITKIIPGDYGKLYIYNPLGRDISIRFNELSSDCIVTLNAKELRETAATLTAPAEYFEKEQPND